MGRNGFKDGVLAAKEEYFAAAEKVLAKHYPIEPSVDTFRKLLEAGKKAKKSTGKKAAS